MRDREPPRSSSYLPREDDLVEDEERERLLSSSRSRVDERSSPSRLDREDELDRELPRPPRSSSRSDRVDRDDELPDLELALRRPLLRPDERPLDLRPWTMGTLLVRDPDARLDRTRPECNAGRARARPGKECGEESVRPKAA